MGALETFGQLSGLEKGFIQFRADELLERVGLSDWKQNRIKEFSKGMAQRLGIAQALINDPTILFLDEPTDGVDPIGRAEIRNILSSLREEGKTIFLNSHLLSEAELICDRVAILNQGKMVKIGPVSEMTRFGNGFRIEIDETSEILLDQLMRESNPGSGISSASGTAGSTHVILEEPSINELNEWLDRIRSAGILITSVRPMHTTLESKFIETIEQELNQSVTDSPESENGGVEQ